ncbi:myospheroid [Carabus blaptoides fortunei]
MYDIDIVTGQQAEKLVQNPCVLKAKCNECIQTPSCAWCFDPDFGDRKRCYQPHLNSDCREKYSYNPDNVLQILSGRELSKAHAAGGYGSHWQSSESSSYSNYSSSSYSNSSYSSSSASGSSSGSDIVQVSPQHVHLKLRIKEKYHLRMSYTQAEDYPVDLYYLMDLSKSMEDDKDKLSSLGDLLAESMQNITSNFRLGFGSFVDKVVMPYVSTVPKNLEEPCPKCAAPYGFHNVMTLSKNTSLFASMVKNASVSGNLDAPEGGFDAIMQAIVCRKDIGWREKARRLLVFSTDAGFHYAGDGKLGGIVKPNDGLCHIDPYFQNYTHSSLQDYPSISQINLKVKENAINVIFAVTEEQIEVYRQLQAHIEGSSSGKLSADSSNVVDLVKEQYQQISSSVEMKDNAASGIRVAYYSNCLSPNGPMKETNKCENLKVGDVVTFKIEIEVTSCPKNMKDRNQTLQIYPVGLDESLMVDLEMICGCPCEDKNHKDYQIHSSKCSGQGTYMCGVCECDQDFFGRHCECSSSAGADVDDNKSCRHDNITTLECSGRGNCVCGQCECHTRDNKDEMISGQFCECDNFSCDRHKGILCSGPDHGECECGKCVCIPPWSGTSCSCRASNDTCYPPNMEDAELCSGHGKCVCGQCECFTNDNARYSGKYCEKCPTCPGRCSEFKECVQCMMYQTGQLSEDECAANCSFVPIGVEKVEADEEKDENLCAYYDEDDCRFAYVYWYDENNKVMIKAQQDRECPPKVFILGIVLGVIAAIVLMGLALLLLWKLLTTIHDRREFAKFEKERMMAKWDTGENPIYKQATSTFKNPTYAGK